MATGKKMRVPPRPEGQTRIVAWAQAIHDKIFAGGLIGSTPSTWVESHKEGVYLLESSGRGGAGGEKIRMLLCDAITGESKYYLVVAEVDPDQTTPS